MLLLLVAFELHKKLLPASSWSSLLKRAKGQPGCGLASSEQLSLLKRSRVISKPAPSAFLVTADAAKAMFGKRPELKDVLEAITQLPDASSRCISDRRPTMCSKFCKA